SRIVKNGLVFLAMFAIAQYVFAVSGIRLKSGGEEKNKSEARSSGAFSNLKSTVTFSLKDNYTFSGRSAKKAEYKASEQYKLQNSIVSYKKGNVVYILPYKAQGGLKLPSFISMSPSAGSPLSR
ncbi:MAG TPA: hypothetical protein VFV68_00220, partial [Agriterribacter sp.]|nr:hypothetical protein [Agriterribacter sp.]